MALWGWGQLALGDRRGWALLVLEPLAAAALVLVGIPLAAGTGLEVVFVAGVLVGVAWLGQAVHAYRLAVRRRQRFGLSGADGGAIELLWLVPLAVVATTVYWTVLGPAAAPDAALAQYVTAWRAGRPADAAALFVTAIDPGTVSAVWQRQGARLRNDLVVAAAAAGPDSGIDPGQPFDSLRYEWVEPPAGVGADTRLLEIRVVRARSVRDTIFGLIPATHDELVPVLDLGSVTLRLVSIAGTLPGVPVAHWRIDRVSALDEELPGPG
jgi:rubredoxin